MSLTNIRLQNFLLFRDFSLKPSQGINVLIGKNGTGKTQFLKAIYADLASQSDKQKISNYFQRDISLAELANDREKPIKIEIQKAADKLNAVYIPVKDMLTHAKGLLSMASKYRDFPFDQTLTDIILKANQWTLKEPPALSKAILPHLEKLMDGQVVIQNEEFFIRKHDGRLVNFSVEAEGLKKIGLLWQLLMNESINEQTVLLWDEPEANLNPEYLPVIVDCLLELSRQHIQIFVSTHNYIFAKYFDVHRKASDHVCYHAFYQQADDVHCETKEHFADLEHNSISQAFDKLLQEVYDLQVGD